MIKTRRRNPFLVVAIDVERSVLVEQASFGYSLPFETDLAGRGVVVLLFEEKGEIHVLP
jgi:hypothetical protein